MEVQGAMLNVLLEKLKEFNGIRRDNYNRIQAALEKDPRYSKFMKLMKPSQTLHGSASP
jgi:dTDP-4-amino-4,6-dideoxygalactose transaminase